LDLLHQLGFLNWNCPECQMDINSGICVHFLPHNFADLMKMRRVCKQWMVSIDGWITYRRIMKSVSDCHRCHLMHYNVPKLRLPHFVQVGWCNLKIKLSNDHEVENKSFPCHYPLHNDKSLWRKYYIDH